MKIYEIILIGMVLAIDACAVAIANCTTYKKTLTRKKELSMPVTFSIFQGIMPLIGFFIGSLFFDFFNRFSNYVTAIVFFLLAAKIVYDLFKNKCDTTDQSKNAQCNRAYLSFALVCTQALATSIDALAVGVTLVGIEFSVFLAVGIISLVTFLMVLLAVYLGKYLGKLFGEYAEWVGAFILCALGVKALLSIYL